MASSDTSKGVQNQAFRFLDLPLEVRNAIYNVLLCSPPPATLRNIDQEDLLPPPQGMAYFTHPLDKNILLVNRQVHAEATDAMLRGNQLVRIRTSTATAGRLVKNLFLHSQLPLLRTTPRATEDSPKGVVLTHTVDWLPEVTPSSARPQPPPPRHREGDADLFILRRDLDAFCQLLALHGPLMLGGFAQLSRHTVEIHNPFDDTLRPDFMGERNQERLLRPYRDHMRGLNFLVGGRVSAKVASSVEDVVRDVPLYEPEQVLKDLRCRKDLGNSYFRQRDFLRAAEAYAAGLKEVERLRKSRSWAETQLRGGPAFLHALAESLSQTALNATQNILTCLREAPPWSPPSPSSSHDPTDTDADASADLDPDLVRPFAERAEAHVLAVRQVSGDLETDWRPTLAQMAKWSYRMASVQRALGRMESAKAFIDQARQQSPADPLIRREAEEIEGLVRSQAGLGRLLV